MTLPENFSLWIYAWGLLKKMNFQLGLLGLSQTSMIRQGWESNISLYKCRITWEYIISSSILKKSNFEMIILRKYLSNLLKARD